MTDIEALQRTLAGEHAAVYVYGVLGGRSSRVPDPRLIEALTDAYTVHRSRRDDLMGLLRDRGIEPVAAAVSYVVPGPAVSPRQLRSAALALERRCAAVYADMVLAAAPSDRRWAVSAVVDSAVRGLDFGGGPEAFPGLAEL